MCVHTCILVYLYRCVPVFVVCVLVSLKLRLINIFFTIQSDHHFFCYIVLIHSALNLLFICLETICDIFLCCSTCRYFGNRYICSFSCSFTSVSPSISQSNGTQITAIVPNGFSLSCNATGYPPPAVSWTFSPSRSSDTATVPLSEDLFINTMFNESTLSVVNINSSRQNWSGLYTCLAVNPVGQANWSTTVLVYCESLLQ